MLQQSARGLEVAAQLVHFGAGLGIFGAHFFHQAAKFTDLILQFTHGAGGLTRRRGRGRLLRPDECAA
jgi:hypothetical protein